MKKLTFEEVINRYEEIVNGEYEFPSFCSYYVTDNDCEVHQDGKNYIIILDIQKLNN